MSQLVTRNTSNLMEILDSKFDDLSNEMKNELKDIKDLIKHQTETVVSLKEDIIRHESTICVLQSNVESI